MCVCVSMNAFWSMGKCMLLQMYFCVCLGLFVQTVHSQLSGNRADHVQREKGRGRDVQSSTERYDSLRFP